jgi:hypothetical protein
MSSGQSLAFERRIHLFLPILQDGEVAAKPTEGPRDSAETTAVTLRCSARLKPCGPLPPPAYSPIRDGGDEGRRR